MGIPIIDGDTLSAYEFSGNQTVVNDIPDGVMKVGSFVFANNQQITEIDRNQIYDIGPSAFAHSVVNVVQVARSSNLTIGKSAFEGCTVLKYFSAEIANYGSVLYSDTPSIGPYAFKNCTELKSCNLGIFKGKIIQHGAFENCRALERLIFANNRIQRIEFDAFKGCTSLKKLFLPEVLEIGANAFENCTALERIYAPQLTTIDPTAFNNSSIKYLHVGTDRERAQHIFEQLKPSRQFTRVLHTDTETDIMIASVIADAETITFPSAAASLNDTRWWKPLRHPDAPPTQIGHTTVELADLHITTSPITVPAANLHPTVSPMIVPADDLYTNVSPVNFDTPILPSISPIPVGIHPTVSPITVPGAFSPPVGAANPIEDYWNQPSLWGEEK